MNKIKFDSSLALSFFKSLCSGVIFFVLTPGVLLTIPPKKGCKQLTQNQPNCPSRYTVAIIHAFIFSIFMFMIFVGERLV